MATRQLGRRGGLGSLVTLIAVVIGGLMGMTTTANGKPNQLDKLSTSAESGTVDNSLRLIPEDAAVFGTMLRNREQFEAIVGSRAWAKIRTLPAVNMLMMIYGMQAANPDSPLGQFHAALQDPENQEALDLLVDMVSDEIFFYGDKSYADFIGLMQQLNAANRFGSILTAADGLGENSSGSIQGKLIVKTMIDNLDAIAVPNLIIGFRIDDTPQATKQLERLQRLLSSVAEANEEVKKSFQQKEIGGTQYLTLTLDGQMIPWNQLPLGELKQMGLDEGDVDKIIAHVKQQTLVIAVGRRDNYVLLSIGSSTDALARLGTGDALIDRAELKPLAKYAEERLTSISYVSAACSEQISNIRPQLDQSVVAVDLWLQSAKLSDQQKAEIRNDVEELLKDLQEMLPQSGPVMSFGFLTDRGIEGYQYNWSKNQGLVGSKPLSLLENLGGMPLLAVVTRDNCSPQQYEFLAKWTKIGYRYFRQYGLPAMDQKERERTEKVLEMLLPLAQRADKTTREMLLPAVADGQVGLVIDRQLNSKQFHKTWPATDVPMPMIEPAFVMGVSDAALLRKAWDEYMAICDSLVDVVRQMEPEAIPADYTIPRPKKKEVESGTICTYTLPEAWGLDEKIAPSVGLSEKVAVVATSPEHVQRLLKSTEPQLGGVLNKGDRPLAVAIAIDFGGMLKGAMPWIELGLARANQGADNMAVIDQVLTLVEVLKVVRNFTSESYYEDDALVSHMLLEIGDLKE